MLTPATFGRKISRKDQKCQKNNSSGLVLQTFKKHKTFNLLVILRKFNFIDCRVCYTTSNNHLLFWINWGVLAEIIHIAYNMAAEQETSGVSLKLLIDDKTNRVVAAEAHKEFVDILFSFLTFPMGTIIRLTSSGQVKTPVTIGCMNNLYNGVQKLSQENWETEHCKSMVLNPRNPLADYCQKLKMNLDDSVHKIKYRCSSQWCSHSSWYPNVSCICGGKTTREMTSVHLGSGANCECEGAFLQKGRTMFIITDDLQIRPASPNVLAQLLSSLGLSEMDRIREMSVEVSKEEAICLLGRSLVSETPLSDVFLPNQPTKSPKHETILLSPSTAEHYGHLTTLNLQVTLNKSTGKLLFAKATNDFFDFLCTFLTIPIGSIIHVYKGNLGSGCIYNLYTSVEELEDKWFGSGVKPDLIYPKIARYHNCKNQPIELMERTSNSLVDPRHNYNFAKEPSIFIVLDNLEVKPLSSVSSFLILKELNVPFTDIEEQAITVGMKEAMSLLKAALTSPSSALANGLGSFLQKQKA